MCSVCISPCRSQLTVTLFERVVTSQTGSTTAPEKRMIPDDEEEEAKVYDVAASVLSNRADICRVLFIIQFSVLPGV